MFSKSENDTYKPKTSKRKYVLLALAGAACLVGTIMYGASSINHDEYDTKTAHEFINKIHLHHQDAVNAGNIAGKLMHQGVRTMHTSRDAVESNVKFLTSLADNKVDKQKTSENLTNGSKALKENVEFGQQATKTTVNPEEIQKNFADSADFQAKIARLFPTQYDQVQKLRQDLKIHHFELSNITKNVELLASSTKQNLRRSIRKLQLREKYENSDRLTPETDLKIWKYEIRSQIYDLTYSMEKCSNIVKELEKLQEDCARTQDDLETTLAAVKELLTDRIEKQGIKIKTMEAKIADAKCNVWEAIFSLGIACAIYDAHRAELNLIKKQFDQELAVMHSLEARWSYFDNITKMSATLTQEASDMLDEAKGFQNQLELNKKFLEQDYTDENIDMELEDEMFMNDYAEALFESLNDLSNYCQKVVDDCLARNERLRKALIWGDL